MISRRAALGGTALLGLVAAAGTAHLLDVDDDVLRALGARPKALPHEGDAALLDAADADQRELLASLDAIAEQYPDVELDDVRGIVAEQLAAVGRPEAESGTPTPAPVDETASTALETLADRVEEVGLQRREDALAAYSSALVTVLASMSAGHAQLARVVRQRA